MPDGLPGPVVPPLRAVPRLALGRQLLGTRLWRLAHATARLLFPAADHARLRLQQPLNELRRPSHAARLARRDHRAVHRHRPPRRRSPKRQALAAAKTSVGLFTSALRLVRTATFVT